MRKPKTITISSEEMDKLESAFKSIREQGIRNEKRKNKKWYIFFTNEQLKNIFGFTDEELKKMTKGKRTETLIVDDVKK